MNILISEGNLVKLNTSCKNVELISRCNFDRLSESSLKLFFYEYIMVMNLYNVMKLGINF